MTNTKSKRKPESGNPPLKDGSDNGNKPGASDPERAVRLDFVNTTSNESILYLEEIDGKRVLPIWIGLGDLAAIAIGVSDSVASQPLTHDLLLSVIRNLGERVEKVVINDFRENTFYARIHAIGQGGRPIVLDSRPCDALALAVRAGCPIYVAESVLAGAPTLPSLPVRETAGADGQSPSGDDSVLPDDAEIQSWLQALQWHEEQGRKHRFKGDAYYEINELSSLAMECHDLAREEEQKAAKVREKLERRLGAPGRIDVPEDPATLQSVLVRAVGLPDPWKDERGGFDEACFYARYPRWSKRVPRLREAYWRWRDDPRFLKEAPDFLPRNPSWEH